MEQRKFEAILKILVPRIIHLIAVNYDLDEISASIKFYTSKTYELLENEDTKLWHFSELTLFNMFDEEIKIGKISFPEEV